MPSVKFSLEGGGPQRIEVTWSRWWKNTTVKFDGTVLGTIPHEKALKAGQGFALPIGGSLRIQLVQKWFEPELQVLHNGKPLPGSASHPAQLVNLAAGFLYCIGWWSVAVSTLAVFFKIQVLVKAGIGWASVIEGAIIVWLGRLVKRRSLPALYAAIGLVILEILGSLLGGQSGSTMVHLALLVVLFRAIPAIRQLRATETPGPHHTTSAA